MNSACIQARVILCALVASGMVGGASDSGGGGEASARMDADNLLADSLDWSGEPQTARLRVTAYCDRGLTASGIQSGVGQCAAPEWIPFGSMIFIPEINRALIVTDRTARRFRRNTVDIFMPDYVTCRKFGRQFLDCTITPPAVNPVYGAPQLDQAARYMRSATMISQAISGDAAGRGSWPTAEAQLAQDWSARDSLSRWLRQVNVSIPVAVESADGRGSGAIKSSRLLD